MALSEIEYISIARITIGGLAILAYIYMRQVKVNQIANHLLIKQPLIVIV